MQNSVFTFKAEPRYFDIWIGSYLINMSTPLAVAEHCSKHPHLPSVIQEDSMMKANTFQIIVVVSLSGPCRGYIYTFFLHTVYHINGRVLLRAFILNNRQRRIANRGNFHTALTFANSHQVPDVVGRTHKLWSQFRSRLPWLPEVWYAVIFSI